MRRFEGNLTASRGLLDVELKRRCDQAPELITAARAAAMPSEILAPLVGARSLAVALREQGMSLGEQAGSENALSVALHRLMFEVECNPNVKHDWAIQRPALELKVTEQRIIGSARVYNDSATAVNRLVRSVPAGFVARLVGGQQVPLFEATVVELPVGPDVAAEAHALHDVAPLAPLHDEVVSPAPLHDDTVAPAGRDAGVPGALL
ncbi:LemA family protein [Rhodococcus oryzae]|uniref:LemA family protein n=1 Tax=Rhodococcus oryzae TaxID=2571143 RepID=UPI00371EEC33